MSSKKFDTKPIKVPRSAAGPRAIYSALHYTIGEAGIQRGIEGLSKMNQRDGFDCPGCAWPDPVGARSRAEFCENGARAVADEATKRTVGETFFAQHTISDLAAHSDYWLNKQGRLSEPLYRAPGSDKYRPISWQDAMTGVARGLNGLDNPNNGFYYTSGRTSNEAAFLYQLFVRMMGTNNLPDCANLCHDSSGVALNEAIGIGKGTVSLNDFNHADLILVIGQNPGTNHPRMLVALQKAIAEGAKVISINPLLEAGTRAFANPKQLKGLLNIGSKLASEHIAVRLNGDQALFRGLAKSLIENNANAIDERFIHGFTNGFSQYRSVLLSESWDTIVDHSGVERRTIEALAKTYARSKRVIACWAMGLTQHRNAVATIQELVNVILMRGNIGIAGAGVCPVRGHSNVQGDRTMGISYRPKHTFLETLASRFKFVPPTEPGLGAISAIKKMLSTEGCAFIGLGGNLVAASPDCPRTAAALENCHLTVHIATKLNRSHLHPGRESFLLPCLGRSEYDDQRGGRQFVSVENSMGIVHKSCGSLVPVSAHLRSEVAIVADLAQATLGNKGALSWSDMKDNYHLIRTAISEVIPGFGDYNTRVIDGFALPNAVRDNRQFNTNSGKAQFFTHKLSLPRLEKDQLLLMTIRSHDQYNTTIYGLNDRYRGIRNERRVLFMNTDDMRERGFVSDEIVDITSYYESETRHLKAFKVVAYKIPTGCCAAYFPETNPLLALDSVADKSETPTSKSIVVRIFSTK